MNQSGEPFAAGREPFRLISISMTFLSPSMVATPAAVFDIVIKAAQPAAVARMIQRREYVRLIFVEVKGRPTYIVDDAGCDRDRDREGDRRDRAGVPEAPGR